MNQVYAFLCGALVFLGWLGAVYLTALMIGIGWWDAQRWGVKRLRKEIERAVKLMNETKGAK